MAGDVINLRQARKTRDRAAKEKQASENRVKFGRTKQQRLEQDANATLQKSQLEGHRRDRADQDGDET